MENKLEVEIIYASADEQAIVSIQVVEGCSVKTAIEQSGILEQFLEIDFTVNKIGIFSKQAALDTVLQAGDRIEIYRPLLVDPKQARKQRAARRQIKV